MSFPAPVALNTQPFKATCHFLNSVDNAIEPFCQLEVIAIGPRIVQVAINILGLVDGAVSSSVLCLVAMAPLPESLSGDVQIWKADALHFTAQLLDKIFRLIIATIPLVGARILSVLDLSLAADERHSGEIDSLRATGLALDREIKLHLEEMTRLRRETQGLQERASITERLEGDLLDKNRALENKKEEALRIQGEVDSIKAAKALQDLQVHSLRKELETLVQMQSEQQAASERAAQHIFFVESHLDAEKKRTASLSEELGRAQQSMEQMTSQLRESEAAESRLREENQTLATRIEKIIDENRALKAENQYMHKLRSPTPPTQSPKAPTP